MLQDFVIVALALLAYMTFAFIYSIIRKRNDIADTAWGIGFILVTLVSLYIGGEADLRSLILLVLVVAWGIRLSTHIHFRNKNKPEDFRYKQWREEWGKNWLVRSFLQVFLLQGAFLFIIVSPVTYANLTHIHTPLSILTLSGVLVWLLGFYFETLGDYQLSVFLKNPNNKGEVMQSGLWRYTRHPNYFGEVTQWWGVFFVALGSLSALWTIVGPLTITLLILKVSGIPMLEKKYEGDEKFQAYKKKTSAFFPLPPKK